MDSFEQPQYMEDRHQSSADKAWRAEVASRVNSYRARRKDNRSDENFPSFDFGPAAGAQNAATPSLGALNQSTQNQNTQLETQSSRSPAHPEGQPGGLRSSGRSVRGAFDTNYYRRLNAESLAQPSVTMSATAAATAPVRDFTEELESETDPMVEEVADAKVSEEAATDLALDLEIRPTTAEDTFLEQFRISEPQPETVIPPAAPPTQGNLIVFRRPFMEPPLAPQPSRDELAEPMNKRPRILEVPEDIMPAVQGSLFPEIRLDADEQESPRPREPQFEIPLRVAPISERLMASLADLFLVVTAGLLFGAMAWRALPEIPHTKPFWMMLGAVTLVFWALYQHMFLLYAGRTPGMRMRGIRLSTFDGQVPLWKQRSTRARFVFISFASVALGFIWALVDEDTLCWHDRISQTFPTSE
ncbi:MAG TPA: RDD family protein [Candidatus Saccharimonadales bacterium]|nr:RDD family protein [Candidatus Saccharimonadales bacterium]